MSQQEMKLSLGCNYPISERTVVRMEGWGACWQLGKGERLEGDCGCENKTYSGSFSLACTQEQAHPAQE